MQIQFLQRVRVLIILAITMLYAVNVYAQNLKTNQRINPNTETTQLTQAESQRAATDADLKTSRNTSPYDGVKGLKEDQSKRDAFSKHYINEDGSFTALIGAGPIHYQKNGQFLDIDHKIVQNPNSDFPFVNATNLMESYFGATSHTGIKNKTAEGEVKEFLNTALYWEVNGQAVGKINSANVPVSVQGDKAYYNNLYGNIAAEFAVLTGKRKLNYIIPNPEALGSVPAGADYLVFTEDVVLPFGWTSSFTQEGVMIKDQLGQEIYLYENPVSTDAANELRQEENTVFETALIGNTLTIKTKVKTEWLLSNERVFPVMVDPTVKVYPDVTAGWTKSVASDGYNYVDFQFGRDTNFFVRGFIKYNLTSIPSSAIINSASGYVYIFDILVASHSTNAFRFKNALDPTTNSGATLYNSATTFYSEDQLTNQSTGWKNSTFSSTGLAPIKNNFGGYLSLSVDPGGSWHSTSIYKIRNHIGGSDGTLKPYLSITYTEPITDRTLEVVGAGDGASHANGSHTFAHNTSVTATSGTRAGYNIVGWEGTGSVPASGSEGMVTFSITQNSSIEWLWEAIRSEFHNYGGTEQLTFNNSKINTENPVFRLSHKGGTANGYQIQISNSADFTSGTVSQTFTGTYAADEENNFTFTNGSFTSGTTYYVRAAVDMGGGYLTDGWTTETYSFTYQSEQEIPSWFQTTQAQFQSDVLSGVNANASHDVVTGAGGNRVVNGDFGSGTSNWTITGTSGTAREVNLENNPNGWGGGNWLRMGSPTFSGGSSGTTPIVVSQEIDLTNVSQITFNAGYYYSVGSPFADNPNTKIEFKVGGSLTDISGTTRYTNQPSYSGQGYSYHNFGAQTIDVSSHSGVQVIKFVMTYNVSWHANGTVYYLIDDVTANAPPSGTITSTPIHLASVQGATTYAGLVWNQTLGGGDLKLKVQQSANGTSGWADVAGYTAISETGNGEKTFDLSEMTAYPHIRLVGTLNGQNVKMHDWAVEFEKEEEDCPITTWWGSPTGWDNGEPTESLLKKVVFAANYTPVATDDITLYACSVEVLPNVTVVLSSDHNMIVVDEVKVDPTATLTIQNGANLVQINDDAVNEGIIKVEKLFTFSEGREQYNLIGSPVLGQNLKAIYDGNPKTQIYNELNNWFDTSDGLYTLGVGQSINEAKVADEPNSLTTAIFEGVPFNGIHTLNGLTAQKTGFHLVANPYPSQLDLIELYQDNEDLETRFLFWDNRGNEQLTQYGDGYLGDHYAQFNALSGGTAAQGETVVDGTKIPNGLAAVGSAFMVRLKTPGMTGSVGFKNSQRKIGEGVNFLGKENETHEKDRYWLTLNTPTDWSVMQLVAYFEEGDDGYGLDDNKAPNSSTGFYSIVNNHHLAIQGKSSFAVSDTIALGYRAFEVGKHRINLFKQEGVFANGQSIYLIDHELDIVHNLSETLYEFETEVGEFNERFLIVYQEDEVLSSLDLASVGLQVFRQNKKTVIRSLNQDLKALKVFNLNGQLLLDNDKLSGKYYHLPEGRFGKEVLLLNITTADGRIHSVKVLTY